MEDHHTLVFRREDSWAGQGGVPETGLLCGQRLPEGQLPISWALEQREEERRRIQYENEENARE